MSGWGGTITVVGMLSILKLAAAYELFGSTEKLLIKNGDLAGADNAGIAFGKVRSIGSKPSVEMFVFIGIVAYYSSAPAELPRSR